MMIVTKKNPLVNKFIYRIKDVEGDANTISSGVLEMVGQMRFIPSYNQNVEGIITNAIDLFLKECQNRIWYFEDDDTDEIDSTLEERLLPDVYDFIERNGKYFELLNGKEANLLDSVKQTSKYKQANADTPVTRKFDENYTLDDYISWLTINQSESENDYGTIAQRLMEIKELYKGYSNELKDIFECNVLVYNTGMESEAI